MAETSRPLSLLSTRERVVGEPLLPGESSRPFPLRHLDRLVPLSLLGNAVNLWLSAGVAAISGVIFWAIAARLLTEEETGLAAATISAFILLGSLADLGMGISVMRFLPGARAGESLLLNSCIGFAGLLSVGIHLVFLLGLSLWSPELVYLRDRWEFALAFTLFGMGMTVGFVVDQAITSRSRTGLLLGKNVVIQASRIVVALLLTRMGGAFALVTAMGIAKIANVILGLAILKVAVASYRPFPRISLTQIREVLTFGFGNHLAQLFAMAPNYLLPLLLLHMKGAETAAHFAVPWFIVLWLTFVPGHMAVAFFVEGLKRTAPLKMLTFRMLAVSALVTGVGVLALLLGAEKLLLVFGGKYVDNSATVLRLLGVGILLASPTGVYLTVERFRQAVMPLALTALSIAAVTLTASYVLVPHLGAEGTGVGYVAGNAVGAVVSLARLFHLARQGDFGEASVGAPQVTPRGVS